MNFKRILEHDILDHTFSSAFTLGGVSFAVSKHLLAMWAACALLVLMFVYLRAARGATAGRLRLLLEVFILYIRDEIVLSSMGERGRKYLHYFLTLFFFILACNLLGLVPGSATATGNIAVTAALSLCTFFLIHIAGAREQGLARYVKSIVPSGLPGWLVPLMFPIELLGFFTKTFALSIRLFMNMIAGHIVVLAFLCLIFIFSAIHPWVGIVTAPVSVSMSLFVYFLELLIVIPLQAYIFTFLTALFVGAAVHPEH
ncbi:MAG: ATP synthase F0 subunit A [Elusimicrobia bacterium RIFCSPLOWO2_01_FULL_64_13]|nr:MAG: ATP synthase F0 subunit A [Elusimicrobia bacterium RIFCSPLOWO2_01_FULL_64_13]